MTKKKGVVAAAAVLLVLICCCLIILCLGAASFILIKQQPIREYSGFDSSTPSPQISLSGDMSLTSSPAVLTSKTKLPVSTQTLTQVLAPSPKLETSSSTPVGTTATSHPPSETWLRLKGAVIPTSDLRDLAQRLKGLTNIPSTVAAPTKLFAIGDKQKFWVANVDTNKNFQITASLWEVTEHAYFWVEDGVGYDRASMKELAKKFSDEIYPKGREFFGSEWTPGVDNDPRLYIIFAGGLGNSLAGYFSSADEYVPAVHKFSNAHETFMLNSDNIVLESRFTLGVLAHEFQHMIHWYGDRNEEGWINEGFSVLAAFLNGYYEGDFDSSYTMDPDLQVNDWPNNIPDKTPNYGAGFLFVEYFLERFGEVATQALVASPKNGLDSLDLVFQDLGIKDHLTGQVVTADEYFRDWTLANYLHDDQVSDGRFSYKLYKTAPKTYATESYTTCPIDNQDRDVHQYGVDYISISCEGNYRLTFQGSHEVQLLPESAHSGQESFWSNWGNESDMTLTKEFDFTEVKDALTFDYWIWYDLEKDYDYLYLSVSEDGVNWNIITTPSCTTENPSGNSFGCGYNGESNGWVNEQIDLSPYIGKKVQIRFEYITDAAVNGEGVLLDDIKIPELSYETDLENDNGGWNAQGFVRVDNSLPQTYNVTLIKYGDQVSIETLILDASQNINIPLNFGIDYNEVVLVVSGTNRYTRQHATYSFSLIPGD